MNIFALGNSERFGEMVADGLGISLSAHEEVEFEDGEHKARPLVSVRNKDVYVLHTLYSDTSQTVNDKLCRLLFFLSTLKDASASRITAVVPYLCYARKDRRTKSRDPVTTRYVAALLEAAGADHVVTIDVHNLQAFQNAFRCRTEHLEAKTVFTNHFSARCAGEDIVIMSPDVGGIKRAEQFERVMSKRMGREIPVVFMEKQRSSGVVWGETLVGEVKNKTVIIIDDLISTGTTLVRAARACKNSGARKVVAVATHGLFSAKAGEMLQAEELEEIVITNTVPPGKLENTLVKDKLTILDVTPLFSEAIKRIHTGGSITELLEG